MRTLASLGLAHGSASDPSLRNQAGLTLIEVLIALLVLTIGLVGIAVLHLSSIKFAHSSYYTSAATALAHDFEERMWVALPDDGGCFEDDDAIEEIADALLALWGDANTTLGAVVLPNLEIDWGFVAPDPGVNAHTDVPLTISWAEGRFEPGGAREQFQYIARVICYRPE